MLANLNDVLLPAKRGGYAVGLFNTVNLEMARGVIEAAEAAGSPVIIGTAEVLLPYGSLADLGGLLLSMARRAGVPVVLHLDHGLTRETCLEALALGYTSIMYDRSADPYEENLRRVKEMADIAHSYGASIEGELGHVGDNGGSAEDSGGRSGPSGFYTDPALARDFVERTGVDALAVAVGNAHGPYKLPPRLDFGRLSAIAEAVPDTPLVLHGGSGISDDGFLEAIRLGMCKINIFTDINLAAAAAAAGAYRPGGGIIDLIPAITEAVRAETARKIALFGSAGR